MSNLVDYAEHELKLIGMGAGAEDEMNRLMHDDIIEIVKKFSDQGHSGFSAGYALSLLSKLLAYEPLTPLTGDDGEWNEVGQSTWQNKRCSHVFKDGKRAYDINGKIFYPKGKRDAAYTNKESHVTITFPYTPKREYVEVAA